MHQEALLPPTSVRRRMNMTQMQHTVSMYIRTNQPQRDLTRPALAVPAAPSAAPTHDTWQQKMPSASGPRPVRLTSRVCLEQLQKKHGSSRRPTPASSVQRASASCQAPHASGQRASESRSYHPLRPSSDRWRRGPSRAAATRKPPSQRSRRPAISGVRRIPCPVEPGHASDQCR